MCVKHVLCKGVLKMHVGLVIASSLEVVAHFRSPQALFARGSSQHNVSESNFIQVRRELVCVLLGY